MCNHQCITYTYIHTYITYINTYITYPPAPFTLLFLSFPSPFPLLSPYFISISRIYNQKRKNNELQFIIRTIRTVKNTCVYVCVCVCMCVYVCACVCFFF